MHNNERKAIACKLTSSELQQRKATVIASLKRQLVTKEALPKGYRYQFKGTDALLDELLDFVKTERLCCDFFQFTLEITGDASDAWLSITGPEGTKTFIETELAF